MFSEESPGRMMWCIKDLEQEIKVMNSLSDDVIEEIRRHSPRPRELFQQVCAQIAEEFILDGYKYLRSKGIMRRTANDLILEISFHTSRWNRRSWYVKWTANVRIVSKALNAWRSAHPLLVHNQPRFIGPKECILWTSLHNIFEETEYQRRPATFQWNVANAETRPATIQDIVSFLRTYVLSYFEQFSDSASVISRLIAGAKDCRGQTSIPGFDLLNAIEYTLCFGTLEQASAVLYRHNVLLSNLIGTEVERRFATFKQDGLPPDQLNGPGFPAEIGQLKRMYSIV